MADTADIALALDHIDVRTSDAAIARTFHKGSQPGVYPAKEWQEAFGSNLPQPRDNMCPLVTSTIVSRMKPNGFQARFDDPVNTAAAEQAETILKRIRFDQLAPKTHRELSKTSKAGIIVGVNSRGQAVAFFQPGDSIYVHEDPEFPGTTRFAAKVWVDGKKQMLRMYYPTYSETFELDVQKWKSLGDGQDVSVRRAASFVSAGVEPNPMGRVPVFEFSIEESDLTPLYTLQPAADKAFADLMVISHTNGSPQRWIAGAFPKADTTTKNTGDLLPVGSAGIDETWMPGDAPAEDGDDLIIDSGPGRTWFAENPNAKFGSLPEASLDGTLKLWDTIKYAVLRNTSIPPHLAVMQGTGDPVTGKAMQVAEAQLAAKVVSRDAEAGNVWEDILGFMVQAENSHNAQGNFVGLAELPALEMLWESPYTAEALTQSERLTAMIAIPDLPLEFLLTEGLQVTKEDAADVVELAGVITAAKASAAVSAFDAGAELTAA